MDPAAWLDHQRRVGAWCKNKCDANDDNDEDDDAEDDDDEDDDAEYDEGECAKSVYEYSWMQKISMQMHKNLRKTLWAKN